MWELTFSTKGPLIGLYIFMLGAYSVMLNELSY